MCQTCSCEKRSEIRGKPEGDEAMEIYADPITVNSRKVLSGLKFLKVDYTLNHTDYFQGKQKSIFSCPVL